jgi:energy-coupling factor transporter ATP-binding protein EcfA2
VYVPPSPEGPDASAALEFPLDEILFQHRLARAGAMEVHACGVKADGGVALFCGKSGSGKTTMARLWRRYAPHATVLSDDRIVVRDQGGRLRAYGTPWHGEAGFADPGSGPIRSVFFLRHARRGRLERLAAPAAAARLFARTFPPLWNRKAAGSVLRTCCRAAREIPCYDFGFRPDRTAVEAVMQVF